MSMMGCFRGMTPEWNKWGLVQKLANLKSALLTYGCSGERGCEQVRGLSTLMTIMAQTIKFKLEDFAEILLAESLCTCHPMISVLDVLGADES